MLLDLGWCINWSHSEPCGACYGMGIQVQHRVQGDSRGLTEIKNSDFKDFFSTRGIQEDSQQCVKTLPPTLSSMKVQVV